MVRCPEPLVSESRKMSASHKSECQSGDWQDADKSSNTTIVAPAEFLSNLIKRLVNLRARAALAGVTLHALDNDYGKSVYIVSRWAMTRELADLGAVEKWLDRVTGGAA
jgi:hypothetical protein